MDTKLLGNISEIKVAAKLVELGYTISFPFGDNARYDLIADDGERLLRVQVKHAKREEDVLVFNTSSHTPYSKDQSHKTYDGDIDCFVVYSSDLDQVFMIPIEKAGGREMTLRLQGKGNSNSNFAHEYILL